MSALVSSAAPAVATSASVPVLERVWAESFPELSRAVVPVRTPGPRLLALNAEVVADLGLDAAWLGTNDGARFLTGEHATLAPVAQVYAGHQWGVYKPILGDGRAALLGERRDSAGASRDLHVKGIGPTPMSRVDGYATVGPMLREYLMGEAMHALGIPTTRALAVVATGAPRAHDGTVLPGAVLARTAASHVRFGSVQYAAAADAGLLRRVADHVIERHYPRAAVAAHRYRALFAEIVAAVAHLTAEWMRVGFVHGVLSTDNVAVAAETIDYGPCAFLDAYEPGAWFSSIDQSGRYAYERQPAIMRWNLERLGEALVPLLADDPATGEAVARDIIAEFDARYEQSWAVAFRAKLGLAARVDVREAAGLAREALDVIEAHGVDFTGFWRDLAAAAEGHASPLRDRFLGPVPELDAWLDRWLARGPDAAAMRAVNPVYIARNHIVEEALEAATAGDLEPFEELVGVLRDPYTERAGRRFVRYARPAPDGTPKHRTFCGT